jgi:hypothetical protein
MKKIPVALGFLCLIGTPLFSAIEWDFSFETSTWNHGDGNVTGWGGSSQIDEVYGTTSITAWDTVLQQNVTLNVEVTYLTPFGTAAYNTNNGGYTDLPEIKGVILGHDGSNDTNTGSSLENFSAVYIKFDQAVTGGITLSDIDRAADINPESTWIDAVGGEGFTTALADPITFASTDVGTGINATGSLSSGTYLTTSNQYEVTTYYANQGVNQNVANPNTVVLNWYDQAVEAMVVYFYNEGTNSGNHAITMLSAGNPVPEEVGINDGIPPVIPELSTVSLVALLGVASLILIPRRRR